LLEIFTPLGKLFKKAETETQQFFFSASYFHYHYF